MRVAALVAAAGVMSAVVQMASSATGTVTFEGTRWVLVELAGAPVPQDLPQEPYLMFLAEPPRVSGSGGCNRLNGEYVRDGGRLSFKPIAATRRACLKGVDTEASFHAALEKVRAFGIAGRRLALLDETGRALAVLEAAATATVMGTVTHRERIALPPTARVLIQLADVSRADAPALVLGEQAIETRGKQAPFAFEISYSPERIEPNHTYAVQARIEDGDGLLFISDQRYPVITRGAPTRVDIVVRSVGRPTPR